MVTINRTADLISGSINGQPFNVTFDQTKYDAMKALELKASQASTMEELEGIVNELLPLTKESYKEVVQHQCPYLYVNKSTNKFYLQYNNVVSSKQIPQALVDRMIKSVEKGIDIEPLVKCWVRFMRNPNFTDAKAILFAKYINAQYTDQDKAATLIAEQGLSVAAANALATTNQVAITLEGLIVGYKVSREVREKYELNEEEEVVQRSRYKPMVDPDTGLVTYEEPKFAEERLFEPAIQGQNYDPFWCVGSDVTGASYSKEGHFIRVGAVHYLNDWKQVNCNDSQSCVPGLHVGGLSYIKGYQNAGTVTHNVLIDPMDIGAVCDIDRGGDGAIRVKRYMVHSSFSGVNKNIYHSSKYAAMTDDDYKAQVQAVVDKTAMTKDQMEKELDEAKAIATI